MLEHYDLLGEFAELLRPGSVLHRGQDVFGGAAQLEQPVLQIGDFGRGEDHRVFGKTAALHRGSPFVGALPARLGAVQPGPPLASRGFYRSPAPGAVPHRTLLFAVREDVHV